MPKIPFRDLRITDNLLRNRLLSEVEDVLINGPLLMGSRVERFEEELAKFCNREFCIGVSSGTDALYLALKACDIGSGDEVITTGIIWGDSTNNIKIRPFGISCNYSEIGCLASIRLINFST